MGLIAREVEAAGIPTLCMSSALSITKSVNPPRAVFLDFPLGHTTGKAHDPELQRAILVDAFAAFDSLEAPGSVKMLSYQWSDDDSWKEHVLEGDERVERRDTPQYQSARDRELAEEAGVCETCVFLE